MLDILIKQGTRNYISNTFTRTRYDLYSVTQLTDNSVKALIRSIDAGQDIDVKLVPIEFGLTSYKFKYMCELSCDSSG